MIRILITILSCMLIGWLLCDIKPGVEYGWLAGIWHGLFCVVNWIRSWFTDALVKADVSTTAYDIFYWIFAVLGILGFLFGSPRKSNY